MYLIYVSDTFCISDCAVVPPFGSSDHNSIIFSICLTLPDINLNDLDQIRLQWHSEDWFSFQGYVAFIDWNYELLSCVTSNDAWEFFYDIIRAGIDLFVPEICGNDRKVRTNHSAAIRKLVTCKHLWHKKCANPTLTNRANYFNASVALSKALDSEAAAKEHNIIESGNLGRFTNINVRLNH